MKYISLFLLTLTAVTGHADQAQTVESESDYCVSFEWGMTYGSSLQNLYCGTTGEKIISARGEKASRAISAKLEELDLVQVGEVKIPGFNPFTVYKQEPVQSRSEKAVIVLTRDRLNIGFRKKKTGHSHKILTYQGLKGRLEDDLSNSALSNWIKSDGLTKVVGAKLFDGSTVNVYVK